MDIDAETLRKFATAQYENDLKPEVLNIVSRFINPNNSKGEKEMSTNKKPSYLHESVLVVHQNTIRDVYVYEEIENYVKFDVAGDTGVWVPKDHVLAVLPKKHNQ